MEKISKQVIESANFILKNMDYKNDYSFSVILSSLKTALDLQNSDFAIRFAASEERINDWMNGIHLPPVEIRPIIIDWLTDKLSTINSNPIISLIEYKELLDNVNDQDDNQFNKIICLALELLPLTKEDFRIQFGASIPSIERWFAGHSAPHPLLRKHVFNFIKSKIKL